MAVFVNLIMCGSNLTGMVKTRNEMENFTPCNGDIGGVRKICQICNLERLSISDEYKNICLRV